MNTFVDALCGIGALLMPVSMGLLFEELILGGLVQLLFAPRREASKRSERSTQGEL